MAKPLPTLRDQYRVIAEKRAAQMARLRNRGWSYAKIGQKYGLTRQRAYQIVTGHQETVTQQQDQSTAA